MSDAGKSMIDASGRLIRGATHPYVLADDLYPMVPTQDVLIYMRNTGISGSCAATSVWGQAWTSYGGDPGYYMYIFTVRYNNGQTQVQQLCEQITLGEDSIEWTRVKKLYTTIHHSKYGGSTVFDSRITKSKNTETLPSLKVIRDDWDVVALITEHGDSEYRVEWDVNGVKPTSLEIAFMFDQDTCPTGGMYGAGSNYSRDAIRVIYNLATA